MGYWGRCFFTGSDVFPNTVIHGVLLLQRAFVGMGAVCEQTLQLGQVLLPFDVVHVHW